MSNTRKNKRPVKKDKLSALISNSNDKNWPFDEDGNFIEDTPVKSDDKGQAHE